MGHAGTAARLTAGLLLVANASVYAATSCGELANAYGPYDYTNAEDREHHLPIVEQYHFTPNVENLIRGESDTIIGDLDYTLRAFPNHHRALYSMLRFQLRHPVGPGSRYYTLECYLTRAIRFAPEDPVPYMLFGIFQNDLGKLDAALKWYLDAYELAPEWIELNYNMGLLYLELGEEEKAVSHAKFAYEHGYMLPGLKKKLAGKGLWDKPKPD